MRHLLLSLAVLTLAVVASADDTIVERTTIGDVPRTFTHFMNAQEAALCRANAAVGPLSSYFFNPAVVADIEGISGQATMRANIKSRNYLPGGEDHLDATDDVFLFSQAVAAKRNELYALGFGYSCPSYRSLELDGSLGGSSYEGEFDGSLRFFEVIVGARIGSEGQGSVGLAVGIANMDESARENSRRYIRTSEMDGMAASAAIGMTFDATELLTFGLGYRLGTEIDLDGDWHTELDEGGPATGVARTVPVAVGGVRFTPFDNYVFYASYIHEDWSAAESTFASYYNTGECDDCTENSRLRDEFDSALGTGAVGAEATLFDGWLTLRAGYSRAMRSDFNNAAEPEYRELVPEYALGLGGALSFEHYSVEAAFSHEQYADGNATEQVANNGIYVTVGYDF